MADSNRRLIIKSAAASAILATQSVFAQTVNKPNPVRIGYTTPRSGAWTNNPTKRCVVKFNKI